MIQSLNEYVGLLTKALDAVDRGPFDAMVQALIRAQAEDRCIYICGNGGSAATASHMVNDLVKAPAIATGCRPLRAFGLADCIPLMTALANDIDYNHMFARQLDAYGRAGDVLIALSGSGNSPNVLEAAQVARARGMSVIAMTGFAGGKLEALADIHVNIPSDNFGVIEDGHLILEHAAVEILKEALKDAPKP